MALDRAAVLLGCLVLSLAANAEESKSDRMTLGRQLFEQNRLRPPADDSPLAGPRLGDGLGPLFNGASCVECHHMAGIGGAGPNDHNVEIVSLALPLGTPAETTRLMASRAQATHPGFFESLNVSLHRFGRDRAGSMRTYDDYRRRLRDMFPAELRPATETGQTFGDGMRYQLAQRSTPALFGTGLIDQIKPSLVRALAVAQRDNHPEVAGRMTDAGAGRFGWRGHVSSLDDFVRTACAAELGLRVRSGAKGVHDQPAWPVDGPIKSKTARTPLDMSEKQVEALVAFVRSLPAPQQVLPASFEDRVGIDAGRESFEDIGCAVCRQPDLGPANGLYSDLLLHSMGSRLADRVAAPMPPPRFRRVQSLHTSVVPIRTPSTGGGGYSGGGSTLSLGAVVSPTTQIIEIPPSLGELTAATEEFRTPPLWGVADSAPLSARRARRDA
ncbi:MAG: hypothetical protein M3552_08785 [Planctomycetota bacterium]|nr:hypothetical protein [Planctomycetota bacterium]